MLLQGKLAEAITEAREAVRLSQDDPWSFAILGYVCAKTGQPEEARTILNEFAARSEEAYVAPTHFAWVYAGLDERDRMFEWLERAYRERDVLLPLTLNDPFLATMRTDPRFADLLRRVGLPRLIVHASVLIVVLLWLLPTLGILVSSLRDKDQITVSGWWTAFSSSEQTQAVRLADASAQKQDGSRYVISGNVFENGQGGKVAAFGVRVQEPTAFKAGEAADIGDGETLLLPP